MIKEVINMLNPLFNQRDSLKKGYDKIIGDYWSHFMSK